jgi:hypothetical protein
MKPITTHLAATPRSPFGKFIAVLPTTVPRDLKDVSNGSFATFSPWSGHFRSTPNNGHHQTGPVGPVRAISGLMRRSKQARLDHRVGAGALGLILATPLSEDLQSAASRLFARPEQSTRRL